MFSFLIFFLNSQTQRELSRCGGSTLKGPGEMGQWKKAKQKKKEKEKEIEGQERES